MCDGELDCGNGDRSDEHDQCQLSTCSVMDFSCLDGSCIPLASKCDGELDCQDGSDETDCRMSTTCQTDTEFSCDDGKCLSRSKICDGIDDCKDGRDEKSCNAGDGLNRCHLEDEFKCHDSTCIPKKFVCDGSKDCFDGSDESEDICHGVTVCSGPKERQCRDQSRCIPILYWCDGNHDCPDGSDEAKCTHSVKDASCNYPDFSCGQKCVTVEKLCDGQPDCEDESDEGPGCRQDLCSVLPDCSDLCRNTPDGKRCYCPPGMHLNVSNGHECVTDHACDEWSTCSQLCNAVTRTRHKCFCYEGYYLKPDGYTCKSKDGSEARIVFSTRNELRSISVSRGRVTVLASDLKNAIALDFYHQPETKEDYLYWVDATEDKMFKGKMTDDSEGLIDVEVVVRNGLTTAEGLAVDWIGGNLYWIASNLDQIEVAKLDGSHRKTLVSGNMESPRSIALDPHEAILFWTCWQYGTPRIESCDMSGDPTSRKFIYASAKAGYGELSSWPNGLSLDYVMKRLYWIDARSDSVHTSNYDGSDAREILRGNAYLSHPFAVTLYENHMYWTDWRTFSVVRANKWNGSDVHVLELGFGQPYDIHVIHPSRQAPLPSDNPKLACQTNNGNCSHLCLVSANLQGFVCACPHAMKLASDGHSCQTDYEILLFSTANEIRGAGLNEQYLLPPISLQRMPNPTNLQYYWFQKQVYWLDYKLQGSRIYRSSLLSDSTAGTEVVLDRSLVNTHAFAIDWSGSGNIYFATSLSQKIDDIDFQMSNIFVSNLNGEYVHPLVVKNPGIVKGIAVSPSTGMLYWNDENDFQESLKMARMDGARIEEFHHVFRKIHPGDKVIRCLSFYEAKHQLYWINQRDNSIQYFDLEKKRIKTIRPPNNRVYNPLGSLTIHRDKIVFSDHQGKQSEVHMGDVETLADSKRVLVHPLNVQSLVVFDDWAQRGRQSGNGMCANSKCQQLCLESGLSSTCKCTFGFTANGTQCQEVDNDFVVFTSDYGLSALDLNHADMEHVIFSLLPNKDDIIAIDVSVRDSLVFWIDGSRGTLNRIGRDGANKRVIVSDLLSPQRLAVDWISKNLYWSDQSGVIEMSDFEGNHRYVVISQQIEKPFAVAVDPINGILFWSDEGQSPKIERSSLDGTNRTVIVSSHVRSVTGLSVDPEGKRLFWCDTERSSLSMVKYDGTVKTSLLQGDPGFVRTPYSVAYFNGYLYWVDVNFSGGSVARMNVAKGNIETIQTRLSTRGKLKDIKIYSLKVQNGTNPCAVNNGDCEEICMFDGSKAVCACSYGKLGDDAKSCQDYDAFVMFSRSSRLESLHMFNESKIGSPIPPIEDKILLRNAIGLTVDPSTKTIYYSDMQEKSINMVNFDGSNHKVLMKNMGAVEGLAFDLAHNNLYWTSIGDNSISRVNLRSENSLKIEKVVRLRAGDKPRGIDVDICEGKVYFTNWNAKAPSIQRAWFSGYGLESVITKDIKMPNAITVDPNARKFFWGDARLDKIERVDMDDPSKRVVLSKASPHHPFDMAVEGDFLFYTDWVLHAVVRVNKYTGEGVTWLRRDVQRPMSLIAVVAGDDTFHCKENPCSFLNGNCDDGCSVDEYGEARCECAAGKFPLLPDQSRCSTRTVECADNFQCTDSEVCIPYNLTCDGVLHCPGGSDEDKKYCTVRRCKPGYLQCSNNKCVLESARCNGVDDCGDFTDESGCSCDEGHFRCDRGPCVPFSNRCDQKPDCPDASDEKSCPNHSCSDGHYKGGLEGNSSQLIKCNFTTACILNEWICDGENDCWDGTDEQNCEAKPVSSCPTGMYQCKGGKCISFGWICDQQDDCHDGVDGGVSSDEQDCEMSCTEDQFQCLTSGGCIPLEMKCDGTQDCEDGSDEPSDCIPCTQPGWNCLESCHPEHEFSCLSDGKCIPKAWVCDGDTDCKKDGADEENCDHLKKCKPDEFRCANARCISSHFYCDSDDDCGDGSDEPDTCADHFCPRNFYRCDEGRSCVPFAKLCDKHVDCEDGSDENEAVCHSFTNPCQMKDKFTCGNGMCVAWEALCDGENDCGDFSDETSCNVNECEDPNVCAHTCTDKTIGYECSCLPGFQVRKEDPKMCDDIDECKVDRPCSQICINTPGSYKCACDLGYLPLDDGHGCKANSSAPTKILFSSGYYVKMAYMDGKTDVLVKNQINAVAIDFDWQSQCVFWSDVTSRGSALRKACNLTGSPETMQLASLQNPDGLAVDWIGRNLYWCDKGSDTIEVSNLDGQFRKVLIKEGLEEPRAVAVAPDKGYLFWTDWGQRPQIGRAGMDGSNPKIILESGLGWPNALAIDYATHELFFGDAREDMIGVSDMNGNNVRVVVSRGLTPGARLHHIFALTVFEDSIFWSDWETKSIESCHKYNCTENETVLQTVHRPMDIQVFHPFRQPPVSYDNPCQNNGGCDALCLLKPNENTDGLVEASCHCPQSFQLNEDGLTCQSNCSTATIRCEKSLKCIPFWWKCDGQDDCGDGSDEPSDCPEYKCTPGQFQCTNSHCIFPTQICDRNDDCGDGSDESFCDDYSCLAKQFKCSGNGTVSGFCIPIERRCNRHADCPNGEDEDGCPPKSCPANHFKCNNGKCIPNVWVCDSANDCGDNTGRLC